MHDLYATYRGTFLHSYAWTALAVTIAMLRNEKHLNTQREAFGG